MEKTIKVWCRGSKENPQGVLKALLDAGLRMFDDDIANESIRRNLSNPKVIFFSGTDDYLRPNFIGYHREDNLCLIPIMDKWKQLQPKQVGKLVDINLYWHNMTKEPIFSQPQHMKNILFWDGEYNIKMAFVSGNDFKNIRTKIGFEPKYYADVRNFLPNRN